MERLASSPATRKCFSASGQGDAEVAVWPGWPVAGRR